MSLDLLIPLSYRCRATSRLQSEKDKDKLQLSLDKKQFRVGKFEDVKVMLMCLF